MTNARADLTGEGSDAEMVPAGARMTEHTLANGEALPPPVAGDAAGPRRIGDYRLERRVGEGGMAEVWLAQQTAPVRRQVAVKLIKPGMDSRRVVAYLACNFALQGRRDRALQGLRDALENGLALSWIPSGIEREPDFKSLHDDPRFKAIVATAAGAIR